MHVETIEKKCGYEKFLDVKTKIVTKNNRSAYAFNNLCADTKKIVMMYANSFISNVFEDKDFRKTKFSEFSMPQKMALIDSMNVIQKSFRHVPRWLSETDAL